MSDAEPRVYSVEDAAEAAMVASLLGRGVPHAAVHSAIERLREYGSWPLSEVRLATTVRLRPARIALWEAEQWLVLGPRGWQAIADGMALEEVRLRLRRELS